MAELHFFTGTMDSGKSTLALQTNHNHAAHVADVFVWVDDLDPLVTAARDHGLAITRGPERYDSTPLGTTEVVIEDQDGYWFCFATPHPA